MKKFTLIPILASVLLTLGSSALSAQEAKVKRADTLRRELTVMTEDEVTRALAIVRTTDGLDYAQEQADIYLERAKEALPESLAAEIRETCLMAADFIGRREF